MNVVSNSSKERSERARRAEQGFKDEGGQASTMGQAGIGSEVAARRAPCLAFPLDYKFHEDWGSTLLLAVFSVASTVPRTLQLLCVKQKGRVTMKMTGCARDHRGP